MVGTFRLPAGTTTAGPTASGPTASPWVRPADWLAMPTPGTQEVVALLAIFDDINYAAVQCQGPYTVDWGDGTVTNYNINVIATKTYSFSSIDAGTTTSKGYRQVLVRITPQAGQNLTSVNFGVQHNVYGKNGLSTGWLDIDMRMPNGTPFFNGHTNIVRYHRIERLVVRDFLAGSLLGNLCNNMTNLRSFYIDPEKTATTTNYTAMFGSCFSLEEVPLFNTIGGNSFSSMFANCYSLKVVPQFNLQNATSLASMFSVCRSLTSVPLFNIGSGPNISMVSMFEYCSSLTTIPLLNTSAVNNMSSMFFNCTGLITIPLIDASKITNASLMFSGCSSLEYIPLLDTGKCTNFNSMFGSCQSLETIPLINTELGTDFNSIFTGCSSLEEVPLLNTGSASTFNAMFNGCTMLQSVPAFNTAKVTTFANAFNNCLALRALPALNFSTATTFATFLGNNVSLGRSNAFGARFAHSYTNMALAQAEIVNIFTNLGTASGAQSINVSSNPGRAALTAGEIAIATGKGWTVI